MAGGDAGGDGGASRRALLFTDIEGSTRLARQLGEDWAGTLQRHRNVLRSAFAAHGGEETSREGDSFFVLFPSSDAAVRAAIAGQVGLAGAPWAPGAEIRVRMGIHAGEVTIADGDHVGLAIHAAARLMATAHGGQVVVSEVVADEASGNVPEASFRPLGRFRFKDFDDATAVLQVEHPELRSVFPPLRATPAANHNLSVPPSTFVGRDDDVVNVTAALDGDRLVTLVGAGGCGKTRLAIETASRLVDRWPDGVWLVELAEVQDALGVTAALSVALGVASPDPAEVGGIDAVVNHLRDRKSLLVLDNCEHVVEAARHLVHLLLSHCPGNRILATSRQPIGLPPERVLRVPSLQHAPADFRGDADMLATFDAGRLFLERAASAAPGFIPTDDDVSAVAEVCARLDGIPLAIELAAARVAALSPVQISRRLQRRGGTGGLGRHEERPGRQQTLEAVIDWSHDLLSDRERVLLRRLSIFGASFTLEAAEEVASDDEVVPADDVLELLISLVSKSLVTLERRDVDSTYRLLETVREYALSKLADAGEAADLLRRHVDWFVLLATETARRLPGVARVHCLVPGMSKLAGDAISAADLQAAMSEGIDLLVIPGAARDAVGRVEFRHLAPEEPDTEWLVDELHDWRVLSAPLRVSAAYYIPLAIQAEVEPAPGAQWRDVERAVRRALHRHFDPVLGGAGTGWPAGEPVDEATVRAALAGVREVRNVVAIGIFDVVHAAADPGFATGAADSYSHAMERRIAQVFPGPDTFIYLDSCWAARPEPGPVPTVRYSTSMWRDALAALRRSESPSALAVIEGRRRGVRLTGGDERWSTRADVVGSHLLDEGQQVELSTPCAIALSSLTSGRGASVDLALDDECLEVSAGSARATLSAPPPRPGVQVWLDEPPEPVVATITVGRKALVDALVDLSAAIGDGGVRLRTDTDGISLLVPGASDLSLRVGATIDADPRSGAVDLTVRRQHLVLAVSSVAPEASAADDHAVLTVHEGGTVVIRSATDPRIVHRLACLSE